MDRWLRRFMEQRSPFTMIYQSEDGKFTKRFVLPISCSEDVLTAYCYLRKQVRTFKLSNILSVAGQTA